MAVVFSVIVFYLLLYSTGFAIAGEKSCENSLILYDDIKNDFQQTLCIDTNGVVANTNCQVVPIYPDSKKGTSLKLLEPIGEFREVSHEMRTARQYSDFLLRQKGLHFVFIGYFRNRTVPLFDGVIVDSESGSPLTTVSMKYASVESKSISLKMFLRSVKFRLEHELNRSLIYEPLRWLAAAADKHEVKYLERLRSLDYTTYLQLLEESTVLMRIFGISIEEEQGQYITSNLMLVFDVRNFGYSFNFVSRNDVLERLVELINSFDYQNISLTLFWSENKVIEVNAEEAIIWN